MALRSDRVCNKSQVTEMMVRVEGTHDSTVWKRGAWRHGLKEGCATSCSRRGAQRVHGGTIWKRGTRWHGLEERRAAAHSERDTRQTCGNVVWQRGQCQDLTGA